MGYIGLTVETRRGVREDEAYQIRVFQRRGRKQETDMKTLEKIVAMVAGRTFFVNQKSKCYTAENVFLLVDGAKFDGFFCST